MYTVKDGRRTLQFEGVLVSESSSRVKGSIRWVEFSLYRTRRNQYVLSRIGQSVLYHSAKCRTVSRNRLNVVDGSELNQNSIPCSECNPNMLDPEGVYPETPRNWAQVSETAQGVVASLKKYDDNGTEYLTNVARELLEIASEADPQIATVYYLDIIE